MKRDFSIVRKGYDPDEVIQYINELERNVETYKSQEQAITKAVIQAQITSENIISEAKEKGSQIERDAINQMQKIRIRVLDAKKRLEVFQKKYNSLIQDYLVTIKSQEIGKIFDSLDDLAEFLEPEDCKDTNIKDPIVKELSEKDDLIIKADPKPSEEISLETDSDLDLDTNAVLDTVDLDTVSKLQVEEPKTDVKDSSTFITANEMDELLS